MWQCDSHLIVIQLLVQISKHKVFTHFAQDTSKWYGTIITCCQLMHLCTRVTYASFHWAGNLTKSTKAYNMFCRHTADITSTNWSGLQIPLGPGDFPFHKLFINLMRTSEVVFSEYNFFWIRGYTFTLYWTIKMRSETYDVKVSTWRL